MTTIKSPFPKLSQAWRIVRIAGTAFGTQAIAGVVHVAWSDRAAIAAVAVAAGEAAYRTVFPTGKLSGQLARLVAAYQQITAAKPEPAKTADPAAAAVAEPAAEPAPTA